MKICYLNDTIFIEHLTKRDVEVLLATIDTQPMVALRTALRKCFGMPHATWATLVELATRQPDEIRQLLSLNTDALDNLVKTLNETRGAGL